MESNLSHYKIFYTTAKEGNISHAAKALYISQPAISKSIQKLESSLETTLFHRSSKGVTLTAEGRLLYEHIKNAFDTIDTAEQQIKKIKQLGIGHVRIGASTTLCKYMLLPYLKEFVAHYPHIKITIDCQSTFHTVKLLEQGKIDIGLVGKPDSLKHLDFYPVCEIEDSFVATKTYLKNLQLREGTRTDFLSSDIFQTANVMLLDEKNITRHYIDNYFKTYQIETNQILEVSNMDLLIEFAKIGLGIACVVKEFVEEELTSRSLIEIPLQTPIPKREIGFTYATKTPPSKAVSSFVDFYKNHSLA